MDDEGKQRQPCPGCGSTRRTANDSITETVFLREYLSTKTKHRDGGKKVICEVTDGHSLHRKSGKWNMMRRLIDWSNNWYHEIIWDGTTGEIIHVCNEPLSEHQGHGSA